MPIWKSVKLWCFIALDVVILYILTQLHNVQHMGVLLYFCFLSLIILIGPIFHMFYAAVEDEYLLIQNPIAPFLDKEFPFRNIDYIKYYESSTYGGPYIQIYFNGKRTRRYPLELVTSSDCTTLMKDLQNCGIKIIGQPRNRS